MRGWGPSIVSYLKCCTVHGSTVPIVGLVQQKTAPIYPRWPDTLQSTVTTQEKRRIARVWWEHHEGERMIGSLLPSSPPRLQSISTLKSSNQPWNTSRTFRPLQAERAFQATAFHPPLHTSVLSLLSYSSYLCADVSSPGLRDLLQE